MGHNWKRYGKGKSADPEGLFVLLILVLIVGIFYPPIRPFIKSTWYIFAIALGGFVCYVTYKIYRQNKLSKAGIKEVDQMSGKDFEMFLYSLFSKLGYKVQHTGRIGDLGSDLIIEKGGIKTAVQAKRYSDPVGPDAIREVNTVVKPRNCNFGMVVTNSHFTEEARYLAKTNNITLWDREELVNNILQTLHEHSI